MSTSAASSRPSSTATSAVSSAPVLGPIPQGVLLYGQQLRLMAASSYHSASAPTDVGLGVYEKKGKHGILNCVPPLGPSQEHLFKEDEYTVLDPSKTHKLGSPVQFGHTLVLVNQNDEVWNNKTGGITGYIGPRPRQTPGEMFVSFHPNPKGPQSTSLFVHFGDSIVIDVEDANRHVRAYNKRLTNFKKPTSSILGGYICCDGKGHDLHCTIAPPKLQVKQVRLKSKILSGYQFGQPIDITNEDKTIEVRFSHDKTLLLTPELVQDLVRDSQNSSGPLYVPLTNGPGGVQLSLQVAPDPSSPAYRAPEPSVPMTQALAQKLQETPVHKVSILVVISSVILALLKRSGLVHQWIAVALAACIWTPAMFLLLSGNQATPKKPSSTTSAQEIAAPGTKKLVLLQYVFRRDAEGPVAPLATVATVAKGESPPVPQRYMNAVKGDPAAALVRWEDTLAWRKEEGVDGILDEPMPFFRLIKQNYPHYYHKRGLHNEPVYYEKPGKIDLKLLRTEGVTLENLIRNYTMISEFLWRVVEKDDNQKCITVIDVEGIGMADFGGEVVDYIRKASSFTGKHYPERCAYIFVVNVPMWFNMIWKVVQGMIDEVTREKVTIVRGKSAIYEALVKRIPVENIPVEYGGQSEGKSPEEEVLFKLMDFNNHVDGVENPLVGAYTRKPFVEAS
ncbi:hypothetical protein SPRG_01287 [Saprolegnia parasitica CBS 223.65]|uniref:CRAL-TRIO domain-containing protein n=1 Tax=Saprolegnia parasitica (strain CBS 223.65) TaxID=695850 RepID=A0A067CU12_SAPPC|nr:hypothetical protein SPRG_01287 [Saprolegnia parasitica CBS 223.65]KDO34013.1 hypothetical protein SPRG_01287 [Saprolegnia parasitica CBS 223.65]|eukprot:XP_012194898.1 hypothetical protein SPRG_01287 [Saprolegnia parasitica CBS 223.65]